MKYLFGRESKEIVDNEIVFALIPHIVRGQELSELNTRAVDVGTANAIDLRRETRAPATQPQQTVPTPPVAVPGPMPGAPQQQGQPQQQNQSQAQPQGGTLVSFEPATVNQATGSTFTVNVSLAGASNVYSVPLQISYDPKTLALVNVSNGQFLSRDGQAVALVHRDDPVTGQVQVTATRPPGTSGVSGEGQVFTLTFMAKAPGSSQLSIHQAGLRDASQQKIAATGSQAMITVH